MIKLYYHFPTKTFYYRDKKKITWGHHDVPLSFSPYHSNFACFSMVEQAGKAGPLVGILTSSHDKLPFGGNLSYFLLIQKKILTAGGLSFVFTPEGIKEKSILGWMYVNKRWVEAIFPYPNVIYNRIPSPGNEKETKTKEAFQKFRREKIPYFNPSFFNKWEVSQLLKQNQALQPFLPETILYQTKKQAAAFLEKHKQIYIKPLYGSKGNGIFTVKKKKHYYNIQSHQGKRENIHFDKCWSILDPYLQKEPYILQKSVRLQTYNNCIFDFRVLVQKVNTNWHVTGIGVRMSKSDGITTHVPKGGRIFPLTSITPPINVKMIKKITKSTALMLEKKYGKVREFSMDIGRDKRGSYWIFEVNAKPMSFDENAIQTKRLNNLITIFFKESGFQ